MNKQQEVEQPTRVDGDWTCPAGWKYLRCAGCGHSYYEIRPVLQSNNSKGPLCDWCLMERSHEPR